MQLPSFLGDVETSPFEYHRKVGEWCKEMRDNYPVYYDKEHKCWLVFRYDDVARVRSDYATFSSKHLISAEKFRSNSTSTAESEEGENDYSLITMDPPRHQQLRSLVTQPFSARSINLMAPRIADIIDKLLDEATPKGEMDVVQAIANPLPVIVISDILGFAREDWPQFKEWIDILINRGFSWEPGSEAFQAQMNFMGKFQPAIEERMKKPSSDLLSQLITSEFDGQRIGFQALIGFCFTLYIAGTITTTNMVGNTFLCLDQNPDALEQLRKNPELIPGAVEEILRYMPPVRSGPNELVDGRSIMQDIQMGEQQLHRGERILPMGHSANFDERQFIDPDHFNVERNPNRHLSFGHGIHFCLGAPLARLELKVLIQKMIERLPNMHIQYDQPLKMVDSKVMFGPRSLPITFTASS